MSEFGGYTHPKVRKEHRCEWCGETINRGETCVQYKGMWDGDWQNWRMHPECHEAGMLEDEISEGFMPYEHERPPKALPGEPRVEVKR